MQLYAHANTGNRLLDYADGTFVLMVSIQAFLIKRRRNYKQMLYDYSSLVSRCPTHMHGWEYLINFPLSYDVGVYTHVVSIITI